MRGVVNAAGFHVSSVDDGSCVTCVHKNPCKLVCSSLLMVGPAFSAVDADFKGRRLLFYWTELIESAPLYIIYGFFSELCKLNCRTGKIVIFGRCFGYYSCSMCVVWEFRIYVNVIGLWKHLRDRFFWSPPNESTGPSYLITFDHHTYIKKSSSVFLLNSFAMTI